MCIISKPVEFVSKTKLYGSLSVDGKNQLTVYSNSVGSITDNNTMILPVPNPDTVKFVDLSTYSTFFEDLANCFTNQRHYLYANTRSLAAAYTDSYRPTLEVYSVGSYRASIVPSADDFDRLDGAVFKLDKHLAAFLREHYKAPFGFIVCALKKGNHTYHPFAYTHKARFESEIFLPTKHYHNGDGDKIAEWDHEIYTAKSSLYSHTEDGYRFTGSSRVKWDKLPVEYRWAANSELCRWTKKGNWKNADLTPYSFVPRIPLEEDNAYWATLEKVRDILREH